MSEDRKGERKGATDKEVRAHIRKKLKEMLPKRGEAAKDGKKGCAGGR